MILITATAQLAYYLRFAAKDKSEFKQFQRIISLADWLNELWESYLQQTAIPWIRLTPWQSSLLWQQLVRKQELALLRPEAIITEMQYAWQLLQQYQIPLNELEAEANSDGALFIKLAQAYTDRCLQQHWVDELQLPQFLSQHLKKIDSSYSYELYGFDSIPPQLQNLCQHLRPMGININRAEFAAQSPQQPYYYCYPDAISEYRAALQWAKQKREEGGTAIGVVIPELAAHSKRIQRITTEIFADTNSVNMDAGLALADYPIIRDTLSLLEWLAMPLPYQEASHLIRSVFWAGQDSEFTARAQLTQTLAARGQQQVNIFSLSYYLQTAAEQPCPLLRGQLDELLTLYKAFPKKAAAHEWLPHLSALFAENAWMTGRALNSAEYQTWERWKKLIAEVAALEIVVRKPFSYRQLVKLLQQRAQQIKFQPEAKATGIHIMNISDSVGKHFSHLWVCGMHAQTWPSTPNPSPFISLKIQRHYAIPHVSYQQEAQFAEQLTTAWCDAAEEVFFSYPRAEKDTAFLPSPLITAKVREVAEQEQQLAAWQLLNKFPESKVPAEQYGLPAKEGKGGARLLQDQSACPFRAYANYRLDLAHYQLAAPEDLGSPWMRGLVVHRTLQLIWRVLKNQTGLLQLTESHLQDLVTQQTLQALTEHYSNLQKNNDIPEVFMQVEQQCVIELVLKWLAKEKQRPNFVVKELEYAVVLTFNGLTLNMRIDRIDQLETGECIIIDYKTSAKLPTMSLTEERLMNPQLPLYALTTTQPLAGTVFAKVNGTPLGFSGWVTETQQNHLPKTSSKSLSVIDFSQQLIEWQQQLTTLAEEFQQGYAAVQPYPNTNTCRNCNLHLLCKINNQVRPSLMERSTHAP